MSFPSFRDIIKKQIEKDGRYRIYNEGLNRIQEFLENYIIRKGANKKITSKESFEKELSFGNHVNLDRYLLRKSICGKKLEELKNYMILLNVCNNEYFTVYMLIIIELLLNEIIERCIQLKPLNKVFISNEIVEKVLDNEYFY